MKTTNVAVAILLGLGVSACGSMEMARHHDSTRSARIIAKSPPAGDPVECAESSGNRCVVAIAVTPSADGGCSGSAVTVPDFLALGDLRKHRKIEWQLPRGYMFCPRAGDGAFFDDVGAPDDLFDLDANVRCSQTLDWKRKKQDRNKYSYTLRFRNSANTIACVKDPWIRN
ncbi:hypothetical protein BURK1_03671 [Burkholderiales bacterium]|nr:hypothetical protein BURK1_03671 [Burkholderiales bacterium]